MHEFIVYFEKLYEIVMILKIFINVNVDKNNKFVHIFVNNQIVLLLSHKFKNETRQYILQRIVELHHEFNLKHCIKFHWILVHKKISSNEIANKTTKKATNWKKKNTRFKVLKSTKFRIFISISKFRHKWNTNAQWKKNWKKNQHERVFYRLYDIFTKKNLKKFRNLKKFKISMLIQIKTNKIELLNYKHKIKQSNIKFCNCENVKNVQHVLLQCFKWANFKQKIYKNWFVNNLTKFLNIQILIKMFTIFLNKTKLLHQFRNYKTKLLDSIFHENKKNRFFKQTIDKFSKITNLDSIFSKISKYEYVISQNVDWIFEKLSITRNHHMITIFDDANAKFFNAIISSFET